MRLYVLIICFSFLLRPVAFSQPGTLDTFGSGGHVAYNFYTNWNSAWDIIVRQDGSIILLGETTGISLIGLTDVGALDANFGMGGAGTNVNIGTNCKAVSMVEQSDGKIVVTGSYSVGSTSYALTARFLANGYTDNSFGMNGVVTTTVANTSVAGNDIVLQMERYWCPAY